MANPVKNQHIPTLPLHLMMLTGCLNSLSAWQCAKNALPHWNQPLATKNPKLNPEQFEKALQNEVQNHAADVISGIKRYCNTAYKREVPEPPSIWQKGAARLLDYGINATTAHNGAVVLFIPSLINRYYILDLEEERSLLRFLASEGHYPLVLDWGKPADTEKDYNCEDYIAHILIPAIKYLAEKTGGKIALAGYCMGGVLSLAAAHIAVKHVGALALLATPWNFHCDNFKPLILDDAYKQKMAEILASGDTVPAEIIQALFYLTDPWVFEQKFKRFASLEEHGRAAKDFIALEHWVNDGVPMTSRMAHDCLIDWAQENQLAVGGWQIANKIINPKELKLPTFIAMPKNDHVVPFDCALPLAKAIKHAKIIYPAAGHVSMIVGSQAKRELWQPLSHWLASLS